MKKSKTTKSNHFHHKDADIHINKRIPDISSEIETFAQDLAHQSRPSVKDTSVLYIPKIKGLFEVLLETVFKMIGVYALLNQSEQHINNAFEREKKVLRQKLDKLNEMARVLRKDIKGLTDISHIINKWCYKYRPILVALTIGEVAVNFKILLIITPNKITALVASLGLCAVLFIVAHSFKDIISYFKTKLQRWAVGIGIILFVLALLYNLNIIRISYMENQGQVTSSVSEWSFVIINFAMFLAGMVISVLYKPLKSDIAMHVKYRKVKKELKDIERESKAITERLNEIPKEQDQQVMDAENLKSMANHYENLIVSQYHSGVALFTSENLFRRVDGLNPKCFSDTPPKLKTYFSKSVSKTKKTKVHQKK